MRDIPESIALKANSTVGTQPMVFAAIWADRGTGDAISGNYRLIGARDAGKASDVAVSVNTDVAEVTLGVGAAVAVNQTTAPLSANASAMPYSFTITDVWYWQGHGWFYDPTYAHVSWSVAISSRVTSCAFPFRASGSRLLNSLRMQIGNLGDLATVLTLKVVDVATNKVVGKPVEMALAARAPVVSRVLNGFSAGIRKARNYRLELSYPAPPTNMVGLQMGSVTHSVNVHVRGFAIAGLSADWVIPCAGGGFPFGGNEGYAASGTLVRSLDVCAFGGAAPTKNGVVAISDTVPAQTGLSVVAYATNDTGLYAAAGVIGWVKVGKVVSGQSIAPWRYWRFVCTFSANPARDDTSRLQSIAVNYEGMPVVVGTHAQTVTIIGSGNQYTMAAIPALNKISSVTSALDPKAKTVMIGKITLSLAPEPIVAELLQKPIRAARVLIRVGYADAVETVKFYEGVVRDLAYSKQQYTLTIQDPLELADVSVPRNKWPSWSAATSYSSGATVTYGNKSYLALANTTNQAPASFPLVWQDAGTVWQDIIYPAHTHLCDIVADILSNQVNIAAERIDFGALDAVRLKFPNRKTGGRIISNPEQAIAMLSDLAWLLESYWTMRDGRMTLILEADANATPDETITPDDIAEGLEYRRGVAELKNECLILTQHTGSGAGVEQYTNAIAYVDATSVQSYNINAVHQFNDKWNLPTDELTTIATNFVNRWKDGRRIIRCSCSMRMLAPETGDVVELQSAQLPQADITRIRAIVMQSDINWQAQTITLTLMEI